MTNRNPFLPLWLAVPAFLGLLLSGGEARAQSVIQTKVHDLSLLVSPEMPCTWPQLFPPFQIKQYWRIGPASAYNVDILNIDPNTGTQIDVPPHSIPLPDSKLPNAGKFGVKYSDKVPAWQYCGEACVVDCQDLLESAPNGRSDLVTKERIIVWEREHRPLGEGDVVLLRSGYTDAFYKPFPQGRRLTADPLAGKTPAWPDPDPECMEYLASRGVMAVGTDSPSMGPIPFLAEPTHIAGLKHGMIFTEGVTNLAALPATGSFYCVLGSKHVGSAGSEARALAVTGPPAMLLIDSARKKNVVDLSVSLSSELPVTWPGIGVGRYRQPFVKIPFLHNPNVNSAFHIHWMDSHSGTHLVPPAYALPANASQGQSHSDEVRGWLAEYERHFGPRGTSSRTTEQVPVSQSCGRARVIDITHLIGTTNEASWPASPVISPQEILTYEQQQGVLEAGDIVVFHSGYNDRHFKPFPEGDACMADPLNGKREGWPAPSAQAIQLLALRGVRCVATDGPTLGGVDPKQALMTYWALGSRDMVGVEFLVNVDQVPDGAYFLFAAIKIKNCHGGPGRALALY